MVFSYIVLRLVANRLGGHTERLGIVLLKQQQKQVGVLVQQRLGGYEVNEAFKHAQLLKLRVFEFVLKERNSLSHVG